MRNVQCKPDDQLSETESTDRDPEHAAKKPRAQWDMGDTNEPPGERVHGEGGTNSGRKTSVQRIDI
jgi:hypothetical protein